MELIKDYDFVPQYHLGNVLVDALSRKLMSSKKVKKSVRKYGSKLATLRCACWRDMCDLSEFDFVRDRHGHGFIGNIRVQSSLKERILEAQLASDWIKKCIDEVTHGVTTTGEWSMDADSGLRLHGRLVVPESDNLKKEIMDEAHRTRYSVHPGETKMYKDLKRQFWWRNMRREIASYVSKCTICQ